MTDTSHDKDATFAPFAPIADHTVAVADKISGVFGDRRPDGSPCCDATYVDGVKQGMGRMFYVSGKVYAAESWEGGVLQGPTRTYYENGVMQADLLYTNGVLDGVCKEFFPSGKVSTETTWVAGVKDGPSTVYNEAGGVVRTVMFAKGVVAR